MFAACLTGFAEKHRSPLRPKLPLKCSTACFPRPDSHFPKWRMRLAFVGAIGVLPLLTIVLVIALSPLVIVNIVTTIFDRDQRYVGLRKQPCEPLIVNLRMLYREVGRIFQEAM